MRFNGDATLIKVEITRDENGVSHEVETTRDVMVNVFSHSGDAVLAARAQGLRLEAVIQLRSCDYDNEQRCIFRGNTYEIESPIDSGEFTRLTLVRRLNNA